jgi:hypothetical protein
MSHQRIPLDREDIVLAGFVDGKGLIELARAACIVLGLRLCMSHHHPHMSHHHPHMSHHHPHMSHHLHICLIRAACIVLGLRL